VTSESNLECSRLCEQHAIRDAERTREVIDAGPFRALLHRQDDMIWLNYAVPVAPLGEDGEIEAALHELASVFAARKRRLRFEFNALPWPRLGPVLERFGLHLHARHPLMVCTPTDLRPVAAPGVAVRLLGPTSPAADLLAFRTVLSEGFGDGAPPTPEAVAALRDELASGCVIHALAEVEGAPAAVGSLTPIGEVAELVGVATRPALRRRGAAATLSSALAREHFASGGTLLWLSAGDDIARAVYEKVGCRLIDERLSYMEAGG
jgi:ribosomal protein S18 acetylase RimI-like enzyme